MNLRLLKILFFFIILYVFFSCSDGTPIENNNDFPIGISGETSFKYELLGKAPIHTQSSMLSGYQNKLYRFGSRLPVQVIDVETKEWSQIPLPDSSFWRWDGLAVTVRNMIYVAAVSIESNSFDIIKLNTENSSFEHTNVYLPRSFDYPAYCVYNENIYFFSMSTDSVYEYNTSNNKLDKVIENPFYVNSHHYMNLFSGKHGNYLYVFGGLVTSLFYRLDLTNYIWEELKLPEGLVNKWAFGSTFGDQFVLFADSSYAYEYSFADEKWYLSTEDVPIYPLSLQGEPFYGTEWSFYSDGESLYATEIDNDNVWKIYK